ncbi:MULTISPECIES: nuclease A inhibitor family protein [unclassified Spirosoma]|uniref:nuclease A inhibitor family protein n=1 Tax=unclassified Spirosoma TaxID=2621999 RepID=UPI00096529F1|nr:MULTISPECIES: nuclease A inhibitor family protein [unclassified Spirosoma]MBN8825588.1 nuclease A inhibitor family protein [Spirosoma sp.]OJW71707.1 MAG: nuclease [Spirosoma sp. 48-14]
MTHEDPKSSNSTSEKKLFTDKANLLLPDLLYPSESDEPIETVTCYLKQTEPLTVSQIKDWLMLPPEIYVEEMPEADFWEPVVSEQDWYGDDEKARTATFQKLQQLVEADLSVRQVFRVGDSEIDVYLLGLQSEDGRVGLKTKIVQT